MGVNNVGSPLYTLTLYFKNGSELKSSTYSHIMVVEWVRDAINNPNVKGFALYWS